MAERRMFAKTIIDSDAFLDMPMSARLLYYDLSMRADDDGFINSPKKIMRMIGASQNDLDILLAKKFLIWFDSGVVVIKHWRIHNYIRQDRYNETKYKEEKNFLTLDENKAYTISDDTTILIEEQTTENPATEPSNENGQPTVDHMSYQRLPQDRLGKDRLGKDIKYTEIEGVQGEKEQRTSKPKEQKHKHGEYSHVLLKNSEVEKLQKDYGEDMTDKAITFLDEYIEMKGYKAKSHYLCIRKWVVNAVKEAERKNKASPKKNKFNNFESREYDFDALEKTLVNKGG